MYKDIMTYELANGVTEKQLMNVAHRIHQEWMSKQKGFVRWEIHRNHKGAGYTDIVYWNSREDAQASEKNMTNIPNAEEWYACYLKGSIRSQNLTPLEVFPKS